MNLHTRTYSCVAITLIGGAFTGFLHAKTPEPVSSWGNGLEQSLYDQPLGKTYMLNLMSLRSQEVWQTIYKYSLVRFFFLQFLAQLAIWKLKWSRRRLISSASVVINNRFGSRRRPHGCYVPRRGKWMKTGCSSVLYYTVWPLCIDCACVVAAR